MEHLIGLTLLWLFWLNSSRRWKKRLRLPLIAIAIFWLLSSPWSLDFALWGITAGLPPDSNETVDVILVLGRGNDLRNNRVALTHELWAAKRAPHIFISGMMDANQIMADLEAVGVSPQDLSGEECSGSTKENALFSNAILRPQGVQKILLVTDSPHMLRALLTFRSFGFHVVPHPSALPPTLSYQEKLKIVLREYAGLISYFVTGQFQPRSTEGVTQSPEFVVQRIADWKCQSE